MAIQFYSYAKCSTCRKAKSWLEENELDYIEIPIVEAPPSKEELKNIVAKSGLPLKNFFNTSGVVYRELGLKDKLPTMSEDEQLTLLSSDGKLMKRPMLVGEDRVTLGFNEDAYETAWLQVR